MSVSEDKLTEEEIPNDSAIKAESRAEAGQGALGDDGLEQEGFAGLSREVLIDSLQKSQAQLLEAQDSFLRAKAEVENIRRRSEQEVSKARKFAVESFASELLTVKDSLDLASNVELDEQTGGAVKGMQEGLGLTRRQLQNVFEKFGISPVDPEYGEKLNPDLHQAMSLQESAEVAPNHILQVIQKGFTLNQRLLRPAMVIVAKTPSS